MEREERTPIAAFTPVDRPCERVLGASWLLVTSVSAVGSLWEALDKLGVAREGDGSTDEVFSRPVAPRSVVLTKLTQARASPGA